MQTGNNVVTNHQKAEINAVQVEVTALEGNNQLHQKRLDDLQDRSRRRNLVIFGLPEPHQESAIELRKLLTGELIGQELEVIVNSVQVVIGLGKKPQ